MLSVNFTHSQISHGQLTFTAWELISFCTWTRDYNKYRHKKV